MKPSGLGWAGDIPADWDVPPLFARYDVALGKMLNPEAAEGPYHRPYIGNQHVQWDKVRVDDLPTMSVSPKELERYSLQPGDVLVCEGGDIGRTAIWRGELEGCCYQKALHRLRPRRAEDLPRFLYYLMVAAAGQGAFEADGNRSTIIHLTGEKLKRQRFPFPSSAEQHLVADFLDRKTAVIDELIFKKERLLARLAEKRQALITQAVTRGLDPSLPMKGAGIIWIPQIPEKWSIVRLKHIAEIRTGIALGREVRGELTETRPYLRVANVQNGFLDLQAVSTIEVTEREARRFVLEQGDVLMNEGGDNDKLGRGYVWEGQIPGCLHQNHVFAVRPHAGVNPYWLNYATQADYLRDFFMSRAKQSTNLASISATNLGEAPIIMPPMEEVSGLVAALTARLSTIKALWVATEESIKKLREYRQTLITAAVTGKLSVTREAA
jgi:type I restriction enzyme, S subunit